MSDKSSKTFSWVSWGIAIFVGVLVAFFQWVAEKIMGRAKAMPSPLTPINKNLDTTYPEFETDNISALFEKMCVIEPLTYKNHPKLPEVIENYKKLLGGLIPDPEGAHVPSKYLNGDINKDYVKYLKGQQACAGKSPAWIAEEFKRISTDKSILSVKANFCTKLWEMGCPEDLAIACATDERLNTYQAEDWKRLVEAVKTYAQEDETALVIGFLAVTDDINVLTNKSSFEIYKVCVDQEVSESVRDFIVTGKISLEQAIDICKYKESIRSTWEEAMEVIITRDLEADESEELIAKYHRKVGRK